MISRENHVKLLKEPLGQTWKRTYTGILKDQFGNTIEGNGLSYKVVVKGFEFRVFSLDAAKEVSKIILNDHILNSPNE